MTAPSIAPPCLAAPAPTIQIFDDNHKRVHPSQAGYVLQPHQDYWIHVTLQGAAPDQWSIRTGRKPDFIASATVEGEGNPKSVKISVARNTAGLSPHFLENGADFTLTVLHESVDLPNQQIVVPLVPAKPRVRFYLAIALAFASTLWSTKPALPARLREYVYLPDGWAPQLLLVSGILLVALIAATAWCRFWLPLKRARALRNRAKEKIDISGWLSETNL